MAFDFKEYYKENREEINRRRRIKYRTDRDYREGCRQRTREYWRKKKKRTIPVDRTVAKDREGNVYFSIGRVSKMLNRSQVTVRDYEVRGIIPPPMKFDTRGWRFFAKEDALLCKDVFKGFDEGEYKSLDEVKAEIWRRKHAG